MAATSVDSIPIRAYVTALNAELSRRIEDHQRAIAEHVALGSFKKDNPPVVLLANGDSWFDYPFGDGIPLNYSDVIAQLTKHMGLYQPPIILNVANAGDTTLQSMGLARQQLIAKLLRDPKNGPIEGILYSGGGDDIAGDQFLLWLS